MKPEIEEKLGISVVGYFPQKKESILEADI